MFSLKYNGFGPLLLPHGGYTITTGMSTPLFIYNPLQVYPATFKSFQICKLFIYKLLTRISIYDILLTTFDIMEIKDRLTELFERLSPENQAVLLDCAREAEVAEKPAPKSRSPAGAGMREKERESVRGELYDAV
jgi:hypothetical protein